MKKRTHLLYYIFLTGILFWGIFLIFMFNPKRDLQMATLLLLSFVYVLTGIIHHLINHDLVLKIMVEYILIAALGVAAAFFIFKGGFGF